MSDIVVIAGSSNTSKIRLLTEGFPVPLSSVTRMVLEVGTTTIDSNTSPTSINWVIPESVGEVSLVLGGHFTQELASTSATLTVFDTTHPSGIVWRQACGIPSFTVRVCND